MSTEKIQRLIARACLGREGAELSFEGIAREDAAALTPSRLRLYRRLVRHNVTSVIGAMLARTKARLEVHAPGELGRSVDAFLDEVGPRTPHLRDVPSEFLAFAAPRWRADTRLPRWLADHAELELLDFTIGVAPRAKAPEGLLDVTADRPLVFAEPLALTRLAWAVNALANDAAAEPEERPVHILVYRDAVHVARFLELTPLAAAILERLVAGEPLGPAVAAAAGSALDADVLAGAARLLADLGERGVLLGARDA
ncbi:MAG: putative DNA-binding domain-containing protein [Labilithrix sp.]|nr:putative DNA-binding domain-containing protein [Labilithrix sp.]MCW5817476.1 putative DNA-binding domain-containing protein [Labilithrix sp.]